MEVFRRTSLISAPVDEMKFATYLVIINATPSHEDTYGIGEIS